MLNKLLIYKIGRYVLPILFLNLLIFQFSYSQSISGFIYEKETGETLIGASIVLLPSKRGSVTNSSGYFTLSIPNDQDSIRFSYVGFASKTLPINGIGGSLAIYLESQQLGEIVIRADKEQIFEDSRIRIQPKDLAAIPAIFGEADVFKALTFLPGISFGNEGNAGLFVRGGSPDQNLILLDNAVVYNPTHLLGFTSTFNTEAINSVDVYTSHFPAKYGNRLSSILDFTMKDGNFQKYSTKLDIGLLSSKLSHEGPIIKNKWTYFTSLRSTYLTAFLLPLEIPFRRGGTNTNFANYWFYDGYFKTTYRLNDRHKISLGAYFGKDIFYAIDGSRDDYSRFDLNWGNRLLALNHTGILKSNLFIHNSFSVTQYDYQVGTSNVYTADGNQINESTSVGSGVKEFTWNTHMEKTLHHAKINGGVQLATSFFTPDKYIISMEGFGSEIDFSQERIQQVTSTAVNPYLDLLFEPFKYFEISIGLRNSNYFLPNISYSYLEPRAKLTFKTNSNQKFHLGYNRVSQFLHQLNLSNGSLPSDIWVPSTEEIKPQLADHFFLDWTATSGKEAQFSVGLYYRQMNQLIDYKAGAELFGGFNRNWENEVVINGRGRAYGLELFHKNSFNAWNYSLSYTYARSMRRFTEINTNNWYPYNFDRPHDISLVLNRQLNEKWKFNSQWIFQSGRPITAPIALAAGSDGGVGYIYGDRNNFRIPPFHRLDVSFVYEKTNKKGRNIAWSFGLYNAYNRKNLFYLNPRIVPIFDGDFNTVGYRSNVTGHTIFPILPFISYSIKF